MKKWIIVSACILTFSGYAAAQSTPAKATVATTEKTSKAEATKPIKKETKKAAAEPIKLTIPRINDSDTLTAVPKTRGRK